MFPREYFDTYWRPDLRDEVFVAMSFAECFNNAWAEIICPAVDEQLADLNLKAHRVDTTTISGSILTEIMDGIANARFVLADISVEPSGYRNANVLYEIGLAHALRQPEEVLLVRQDSERIAFDVASVRVHYYDPIEADSSKDLIASLIRECMREIDLRKGLKVQQAIEMLDQEALHVIDETKEGNTAGLIIPRRLKGLDAATSSRLHDELAPKWIHRTLARSKMLELGIIRCDVSQGYPNAYLWTPFGRAVIDRLYSADGGVLGKSK